MYVLNLQCTCAERKQSDSSTPSLESSDMEYYDEEEEEDNMEGNRRNKKRKTALGMSAIPSKFIV